MQQNQRQISLGSLSELQQLLKQEFLLISTCHQQHHTFSKKLETQIHEYYRMSLSHKQPNSFLFEDEGFGNAESIIKETMLTFSKFPDLAAEIIRLNLSHSEPTQLQPFISLVVGSAFENICVEKVEQKPLLHLLESVITMAVEKCFRTEKSKKHDRSNLNDKPNHSSSQENVRLKPCEQGLAGLLFQTLMKNRDETRAYSKQVLRYTMLEIAKIDHQITLETLTEPPKKPQKQRDPKIVSSKTINQPQDSKLVSNKPPMPTIKRQLKINKKKSKVQVYREVLKAKDQQFKEPNQKGRNKEVVSHDLLSLLGIVELTLLPSYNPQFTSSFSQEASLINSQHTLILSRQIMHSSSSDIDTLRSVLLKFFSDVFNAFELLPHLVRLVCRRMHSAMLANGAKSRQAIDAVCQFIFGFWLADRLKFGEQVIEATKSTDQCQLNADFLACVIRSIISNDWSTPQLFKVRENFGELVTHLRLNIQQMVLDIIALPETKLASSQMSIFSHCVCANLLQIKTTIELLNAHVDALTGIDPKLPKRLDRIKVMTKGATPFAERYDPKRKKLYSVDSAYYLFEKIVVPEGQTMGSLQSNAYRKESNKNMLSRILLNCQTFPNLTSKTSNRTSLADIDPSEQLDDLSQQKNLTKEQIVQMESRLVEGQSSRLGVEQLLAYVRSTSLRDRFCLDKIPVDIRINYFRKHQDEIKLGTLVPLMITETKVRLSQIQSRSEQLTRSYLNALSVLLVACRSIETSELTVQLERGKKQLEQFLTTVKVNLCLSSAKTRAHDLVSKTQIYTKDCSDYERSLIWLENQSTCIHSKLNLDSLLSLTGQAEKGIRRYDTHFDHIGRFSQKLCSLPEVRERAILGLDDVGVKETIEKYIECMSHLFSSQEGLQIDISAQRTMAAQTEKYKPLNQYSTNLTQPNQPPSEANQLASWVRQHIQQRISQKIYQKVFPKHPTYDDIAFYIRTRTLEWLNPSHFGVLVSRELLQVAAYQIVQMDRMKTAGHKLDCLVECYQTVVDALTMNSMTDQPVGADLVFPGLLFCLVASQPRRFVSNMHCSFIELFCSPNKLQSQQGYILTSFRSAYNFICASLDGSALSCPKQAPQLPIEVAQDKIWLQYERQQDQWVQLEWAIEEQWVDNYRHFKLLDISIGVYFVHAMTDHPKRREIYQRQLQLGIYFLLKRNSQEVAEDYEQRGNPIERVRRILANSQLSNINQQTHTSNNQPLTL